MRFTQIISSFAQSYSTFFVVGFCIVFFSVIAYYAVNAYKSKLERTDDKDLANQQRAGEVTIMMFAADWCKHCIAAKPIWDSFEHEYNNLIRGTRRIICSRIDCTDPTDEVKIQMEKFGVDSFPTILMVKDGRVKRFDASVTKEHLDMFIDTV